MITCPNKNLKEWKDLVSQVGEARAGLLWVMVDGETSKLEEVNFELKSVNILQSNKAKEIFEKGKKNNWDLNKILTELQIPKEQRQLILDLGITENKANVILPIGTSGSGKSTFIKSLTQENLVVIEPDAMRVEFTGDINDKSKDKEIYIEAANRAVQAIKQGKQVVFDTTNLTKDKRLPFIESIKKAIPTANIQYKLMELNPELAKQRIKAQLARGENRAAVSDETINRHAESYKQMLEDIKSEPISEFKNIDLREQIALELASKYSYTVEINTAKEQMSDIKLQELSRNKEFQFGNFKYFSDNEGYWKFDNTEESLNNRELTRISLSDYTKAYRSSIETSPTKHYSNITVNEEFYKNNPDWEYKEQRITTPLITPSIKGHAQFAESNDIGWFRAWYNKKTGEVHVIEVQSDVFQKGRDEKFLISNLEYTLDDNPYYKGDLLKSNQFLQLLNKDSNWVTFFIKSIIQDSAKKGYEKVLFPSGNTASKVEGHQTLEEFKKQKEDRIGEIERKIKYIDERNSFSNHPFIPQSHQELEREDNGWRMYSNNNPEQFYTDEQIKEPYLREINQLKQELERVNGPEGFGALKPIYNFYENTVTNILNKTYGKENVKLITDEYGNTWNEVTLEKKNLETILFSKKPQPRKEPNDLHSKLTAKDIYGKRYIQPIGSTGQYRILKDWKAKGLSLVKKLENEYPGVLSWKTVNNEVIISVNPQMGLKFSKESSTEKVSEDVLIPILDKLKARFNLDYKIINDPSLDWAGTYDGNVVVINSAKAGLDTPFHEFAHPFIRIIRNTNRPLYNRLVKEINDTKEGKVALEGVKQDYPELKDTDQVEEAIVTLIGAYAEDNLKSKSLIKRIQEFLQEILNSLGLSKINPKDLSNLSLRELGAIMASDLDVDISQAKQFVGEGAVFKSKKEETYGEYETFNSMPFQKSTIDKMKNGEQRVTIRTRNHKDGIYILDGEQYHILNMGLKNISEFKNPEHLKSKFKGDSYEEGKFEHIDKFFKGKKNLYVYQITKINNEIKNEHVDINPSLNTETNNFKNKEQKEQAFEKQFVFFTRRIYRLEKDLKNAEEGSTKYNQLKAELDTLQEQLKVANEEQSESAFLELGKHMLSRAAAFIQMLETDKASVSKDNLLFTINTLATFKDFPGLETDANSLFRRVYPFLSQHTLELINKYKTENKEITQSMIDKQDTDISAFTKSVGALSDLANYIGRTIGSLIKAAQNRASSTNKALLKKVQAEVDKLEEFAKSNNMKLEDVYNMMIDTVEVTSDDVKYKDLALVAPYINGKQNPKWEVLNRPENKPIKEFYDFYQDIMSKAANNLPYKVSKFHIPNIAKTDIKYRLKNLLKVEDVLLDEFRTTEDLHADMVPSMFRARLHTDKKSRDLGASILEFAAYSNMHHELSKVLPEARLLQEQVLYKQLDNGIVSERKFIKSTDPKTKINARDSNLYKMIDIVIDMQLKGKMSKDTFKPVKTKDILDENGEVIGYKQVRIDDALDLGLKYNSLLRIGLSPITALANVSFGDVSNIIESIGGRFFGFKELRQATNIFFKQIDYTSNEKNSELYKWLDALNPLQELDDYNISDRVRLNKMTPEKAQEYMYALQKKGELFLQSRTMLAVLIKEGYMTKDGKTTKEGLKLMQDPEALQKMSDKIQRLNQMIHGRYSQREAATLQQSVIYRMMIQFRKWIPSAIEARIGEKQYDNRLGVEIEGRYVTFKNLILNLNDTIDRLKSGKLTELEIYNMKKNLTEIVLLTASILGYAWLHGGDDEEAKKRRKNPYVKTLLTLTDRVSGDLGFFYNPANYTNLARNAIPLAKTVDDLRKVVMNIPYAFYVGEWENKKGNLKGTNKFYSSAKKVMIGLKPLQDIEKLFNNNPLDEFH